MNWLNVLALSIVILMANASEYESTKPMTARELKPSPISGRIVNGERAPINRYPYAISLQSSGFHICGASLIAPDLALSAAHCQRNANQLQINPHSLDRPILVSERFDVIALYIHPLYVSSAYANWHDFMIVKFDGNSSLTPVRVNDDQSEPEVGDRLVVMGWGTTIPGINAPPDILHHVNVSYIDNEQCVAISQGSYDGVIADDMLCSQGSNKDSCQGDSGGPLVIPGDAASEDVQVGIVSWGYGCAEAQHPGVNSRTSEEWAWIRAIVCGNSNIPPLYFRCDEGRATFSPAPTSTPTVPTFSPAPSGGEVDVLVVITLDQYASETGFQIRDLDDNILFEILPGEFGLEPEGGTVTQAVSLNADVQYVFVLVDAFGDGLAGEAIIYMGISQDPSNILAYYNGIDTMFSYEHDIPFGVGEGFSINIFPTATPRPPSPVPSAEPSAPSISPAPTGTEVTLMIILNLDAYTKETAYSIVSQDGEVIREVAFKAYASMESYSVVREEFQVSFNETYDLVIRDSYGDGLRKAVYLYLGFEANTQILAYFDPNETLFTFDLTIPFRASTDGIIQVFPTSAPSGPTSVPSSSPSAPTVSPAPSSLDIDVYIEIETTLLGDEVGWTIATMDGGVLYFVETGTYSSFSRYNETVVLPQNQDFVFTIVDQYGDGFQGNITLYLGPEPAADKMIYYYAENGVTFFFFYSAKFTTSEDATFPIFPIVAPNSQTSSSSGAPSAPTASPAPSGSEIQIFIQYTLDEYPSETGYQILNSNGEIVYELASGSFFLSGATENAVVVLPLDEDFTFVITDSYGDGFNGKLVVYFGQDPLESSVLGYYQGPTSSFYAYSIEFTTSLGAIIPTFEVPLNIIFDFPDSVGWSLGTEQVTLASKDPFALGTRSVQVNLNLLESTQLLVFYIFPPAVDLDISLVGSYKITSGNKTLAAGDHELGTSRTHFFNVESSGTVPITMFLKASSVDSGSVSWQLTEINFFGNDVFLGVSSTFIDKGSSIAASRRVDKDHLYKMKVNSNSQFEQHVTVGSADPFEGRMLSTRTKYSFVAREMFDAPVVFDANSMLRLEVSFGSVPSQIGWALYMNVEQSPQVTSSRQASDALEGSEIYSFGPDTEYASVMAFAAHEEEIPLPTIGENRFREFTFVIYSRFGNGLRPSGQYKVYDGERLVALGSIVSGFADRHIFSIAGPKVPTAPPTVAPNFKVSMAPSLMKKAEGKTEPPISSVPISTPPAPSGSLRILPHVATAAVVVFCVISFGF